VCVQAGAPELALEQQGSEPAQPQLAEMQLQMDAMKKEMAQLQATRAPTEQQPEVAAGQLAPEGGLAAALRAEDQRIAGGHRELQEAWKGMVDELKEQLKVMRGEHLVWKMQELELENCWTCQWMAHALKEDGSVCCCC
jgi:hypothetical protein